MNSIVATKQMCMNILSGMNISNLNDIKAVSTAISTLTADFETINKPIAVRI